MEKVKLKELAEQVISTWNTQDVEKVVGCYSDDLVYRDPNTRGEVRGPHAMGRYLRKLFAAWQMHWSIREVYPLDGQNGAAVLWHASIRKTGGKEIAEVDGMDLILLRGGRIERNEVYFDRAVLAPLITAEGA
jgi:ketosteroid isomerase-like protein